MELLKFSGIFDQMNIWLSVFSGVIFHLKATTLTPGGTKLSKLQTGRRTVVRLHLHA